MNDNKQNQDMIIRSVEDEKSEIIEEIVEEIENEAFGIVEDTIQEVEKKSAGEEQVQDETKKSVEEETDTVQSEVPQTTETSDDFALPPKAKKHTKAKLLVKQANNIVNEADKRTQACKLLLENSLKKYEDAKSELKAGGFDACVSLVTKLGCLLKNNEPSKEEAVVFEVKEEVAPLMIKDVSSGKFTGLIYALIVGFFTAVGLVYLATEKLEMTLNVTKVPSEDIVQSLLAWFSTVIGIQEDVYIGAGVFGFSVLFVMILVYVIHVVLKANRNLHFAVKQFVEAELYTEKKANCKTEVDKVVAHIKDMIDTMKRYEVLFSEQRGKLQRILYIEGEKEKSTDYHDKSYLEIRDTKELIHTIKDVINTPMSQEGKLSSKNVLLLQNAKDQIDKVLKRFY